MEEIFVLYIVQCMLISVIQHFNIAKPDISASTGGPKGEGGGDRLVLELLAIANY